MELYAHMDSIELVKAVLVEGNNVDVIAEWANGSIVEEIDALDDEVRYLALNIQCDDGVKRASLGDYVVMHEDGHFSIHQTLEFQKNYKKD